MRSFFKNSSTKSNKKSNPKHSKRGRKKGLSYGTLEERRVLATTALFVPGTDTLTVTLTQNTDDAVIDVVDDVVTVNNQAVNGVGGPLQANDVRRISVEGLVNANNQTVVLNGNFTDAAGRDLDSVFVQNVNQVSVLGAYDVDQNFTVFLDGSGGNVADGPVADGGRLIVAGTTTINAGNNSIQLDNATNDFAQFSAATTSSINNNIVVSDLNSIELSGIDSAGGLTVVAGGAISDAGDIEVERDASFTATNISLGGDDVTTNFRRVAFSSGGTVELQEDTNITVVSSDVQSLRLTTPGAIFDGTRTTIDVEGLAVLNGASGIRVGDNGTDTFNAGFVTFNSTRHVSISERSNTNVVGTNTARSWTSRSTGDITNGSDTSIVVGRQTGLAAANVILGNQGGDNFETGQLFFFATNRFELQAESNIVIIERKNESGTLDLRSEGTITDDELAHTNIRGLAQFTAQSVDLGDTRDDQFNAGSIQFDTETTFQFNENSGTNIVNASEAGLGDSNINSTANITNSADATVDIEGSVSFFGENIILGNRAGDSFEFGVLSFNTSLDGDGLVNIAEDDSTLIGGANTATNLRIDSLGAITDGQNATINVLANSRFTAVNNDEIVIGDRGVNSGTPFDSIFNSGSLTVRSDGDVFVEEDSLIRLTGTNLANNLTLSAGLGSFDIVDSSTSRIRALGTLNLTGNLIDLGTGVDADNVASDRIVIAGLTSNSQDSTRLSVESSFQFRGDSRSVGSVNIDSGGRITAATDATFEAFDSIFIIDSEGQANPFAASSNQASV